MAELLGKVRTDTGEVRRLSMAEVFVMRGGLIAERRAWVIPLTENDTADLRCAAATGARHENAAWTGAALRRRPRRGVAGGRDRRLPAGRGEVLRAARTWAEDVTLTGADTILAQEIALRDAPRPGPAEGGPLLAVVDGRCRVRNWDALREVGHWSDVVALRCASTPAPTHRWSTRSSWAPPAVDLAAALRALGERPGVEVVRVDSGGGLLGALLDAELVDEVSLLVHPCLVGPAHQRRWHGQAVVPKMAVTGCTVLDGLVWLRYRLGQEPRPRRPGAAHPRDDLDMTCRCHRLRGKSRRSLSGGRNGVQAPSAIPSRSASSHSTAGL